MINHILESHPLMILSTPRLYRHQNKQIQYQTRVFSRVSNVQKSHVHRTKYWLAGNYLVCCFLGFNGV